jgi:urease accessory protein
MLCAEEIAAGTVSDLSGTGRVRGALRLDFERDPTTGLTVLAAAQQQPPLRVVRAFPIEDGAALVHLHNVSGGLLGGDRLKVAIGVGRGASVQVTTTGATRLYRPRVGAPAAIHENDVSLEPDALLEYVPDALIPFSEARFDQQTNIRLGQGAGLFWWETVAPGREARGELFAYDWIRLRTHIAVNGRPIAIERVELKPCGTSLFSPARLGSYRYFATFYVCRVGFTRAFWLEAEERLREVAIHFTQPGCVLLGVSALVAHGLVIRCLATHGCDVLPCLYALWRAAKLLLYGREPVPPRKVY